MPERAPSQGGGEKSAAAVVVCEHEGPNGRRVSQPCISTTPGGRSPGNRSSRLEVAVKPRRPGAAVEASTATHGLEHPGVGRQLPNRRMRTRLSGGGGGE